MKSLIHLRAKIAITGVLLAYTVLLYITPLGCPFFETTGVPCLGCGMTRAWMQALQLHIGAAFSYHFMFWSVPLLYLSFLKDGYFFRNKTVNLVFHVGILSGFILNWLFHL